MLNTLSKFINIQDTGLNEIIQELKLLELQIPIEEQINLVESIFNSQKECSLSNQSCSIQIGNQYELDLLQKEFQKPILGEYLEMQYLELNSQISKICNTLKTILELFDSTDSFNQKQQIYQFKEESQIQGVTITNDQELIQKIEPNNQIYQIEFTKFIKDQKQLINHKSQLNQLQNKFIIVRKEIFSKIEDQNNFTESVAQKMEMNIENELKLLEKTIQLKTLVKIEKDLQTEILTIEKQKLKPNDEKQSLIINPELLNQKSQTLFNDICKLFQEVKEQKIKNNDFIFSSILQQIDNLIQFVHKIAQQQENNIQQIKDYFLNCSDEQQCIIMDNFDLIQMNKQDYEFCNYYSNLNNNDHENSNQIVEFFKLTQQLNTSNQEINKYADEFNQRFLKQLQKLEIIRQYLHQLVKFE